MGYRVAVVGATGNVGREMLAVLAEREFPCDEVAAVASSRSTGTEVEFGDTGKMLKCQNIEHFDWAGWDIALFAAGSGPAKDYAPKAAAAGCVVIDNSSLYRMDPDVPLIVPEVNPDAIDGYKARKIIANPNCSTAQMVVALKPLHDAATIKRVVVSTYQSVSGAGKEGMDELFEQSRNIFVGDPAVPRKFTKQIAFNVIPHIDVFLDDGSTKEEWKMVVETKKILDPKIKINATCVRVPVFVGHSEAINTEFERSEEHTSELQSPCNLVCRLLLAIKYLYYKHSSNIIPTIHSFPTRRSSDLNVIPHIDVFLDDGSTKEEWKMVVETKKILDPKIKINATCVRVPVFVGHSEAINTEFEREISAEQAQDILREAPGIMLVDKREDGGYVTPIEAAGDGATYVSRVREDPTVENGLTIWCVSDNLRKGAALNAVQIAELLGRRHLKKG